MYHSDIQWASRRLECAAEIASGSIGEGSVPLRFTVGQKKVRVYHNAATRRGYYTKEISSGPVEDSSVP